MEILVTGDLVKASSAAIEEGFGFAFTIQNPSAQIPTAELTAEVLVLQSANKKLDFYAKTTQAITNNNAIDTTSLKLGWGLDISDLTVPEVFRIYTLPRSTAD